MAKKVLILLVLVGLASGGLFAADFSLSVGGGGFFNGLFGSTTWEGGGNSETSKQNVIGGGAFLYFDATYAEADLDILFSSNSDPDESDSGSIGLTHFGFSLLGKYPFDLGAVKLFPLLGIDYQLFLSGQMKDKDGEDVGDAVKRGDDMGGDSKIEDSMDFFSIQVGAGVDYGLTDALYIRGELLWGFKLDSKSESDAKKDLPDGVTIKNFTSGPRIKIAVGYKF